MKKIEINDNIAAAPLEQLQPGDEIVGPFGDYHFRVTSVDGDCIEGVYTKGSLSGYPLGGFCRYPKSDWKNGEVQHVQR